MHRLFGWKFWSIVVGAAPLDPELEAFWTRLGFVVIQGYGLTETAPIVTLNHPFRTSRGTVGAPIAGVEVSIAPDGEILVRGDNVTSGYYNAPDETARGVRRRLAPHRRHRRRSIAEGRLTIRGRKKEMIVTPEGLNVFPEDVERALEAQPGVKEAAVVGASATGAAAEERVHAVLVLEPGANAEADRRRRERRARGLPAHPWRLDLAGAGAAAHRRHEQAEAARACSAGSHRDRARAGGPQRAQRPSRRSCAGSWVSATSLPAHAIEALGLSSLERVELMMALEEAFETTIDEAAFAGARTVGDLSALVGQRPGIGGQRSGIGSGRLAAWPLASGLSPRTDRLSLLEPIAPCARDSPAQPADLDPADCAHLRVARGRGPGAPRSR